MELSRRRMMTLSAAGFLVGAGAPARAAPSPAEQRITILSGGRVPATGRVTLTAPEIAEDGNAVAVSIRVEGALDGPDRVETVTLIADGNPIPEVATFHFTPLSGRAEAMTRIRLARTQTVTALARMADGSVHIDRREIKVTIGGCGG